MLWQTDVICMGTILYLGDAAGTDLEVRLDEAAQLLADGKTDEAKELLRGTLKRQTQEVLKFMREH